MNLIDHHAWTSKHDNCNYVLGTYSVMSTIHTLSQICITTLQGMYDCPYFIDLETEAYRIKLLGKTTLLLNSRSVVHTCLF